MPLIYRSIRMDNNDIPLRSGQGEKYPFVNLKFHVDQYRGGHWRSSHSCCEQIKSGHQLR